MAIINILSIINHLQILLQVCEKVASDLGLAGGFPPPLWSGYSHECNYGSSLIISQMQTVIFVRAILDPDSAFQRISYHE